MGKLVGDKYGIHRVIEPQGVLTQAALKIDNDMTKKYSNEIICDVISLNIDSASFTQIEEACGGDTEKIKEMILGIVNERGKMQNPVTGSGGMFIGKVAYIGEDLDLDIKVGDKIASLVSLSMTPLKIDEIIEIHPEIDRVDIKGQAVLFESALYAKLPDAKEAGYKAGDFSYNTGKLRCPTCDGTGSISLDVQFLPDVEVPCPDCHGSRYNRDAGNIKRKTKSGELYSLPELMDMDVQQALRACEDMKKICSRLQIIKDLGLGYLTLGEATPNLSGGEAQRLKLASEMVRKQDASVFVFDEPTIGLHPLDVQTLLKVFDRLVSKGATVIVIEHDLDVIRNADYIIDMGPGGGEAGGRIIAKGTPEEIASDRGSITGKYLR